MVLFIQDIQKQCALKDECFVFWFKNCVLTVDYDDLYNKMIYIENNIDELMDTYNQQKQASKKVIEIIRENPGILQKELYKLFSADLKNFLSSELYKLDYEEKIIREKSGNSYKLYLKDAE